MVLKSLSQARAASASRGGCKGNPRDRVKCTGAPLEHSFVVCIPMRIPVCSLRLQPRARVHLGSPKKAWGPRVEHLSNALISVALFAHRRARGSFSMSCKAWTPNRSMPKCQPHMHLSVYIYNKTHRYRYRHGCEYRYKYRSKY